MEFSGLAYCAENKRLSFSSFPILSTGTLIQKSSDMGAQHSKEMPFVELTGHQMGEPIVHPAFHMNEFSKGFGIAGKIHHFTTKNFVRSESFLSRKDLYEFSFSQLVGGFVGSKSQIGSSSKESHLIWDIIFGKLAEFCGTHHHQDCFNLGTVLSQQVLDSFCHKDLPVPSEFVTKNSSRPNIPEKASHLKTTTHCNSNPTSDISKQSYAEVAKTFAINHQNEKSISPSVMPRRKNPPNRRNLTRCQITRSVDTNWRIRCNPPVKEFRNHTRFFSGGKNRPRPDYNRNYKSSVNFEKEHKTEERRRESCNTNTQRANSEKDPKRMISNSVQTIAKDADPQVVCASSNNGYSQEERVDLPSPRRMRCLSECSTVSASESTASDDSYVVFDYEAEPVECVLEIDISDDECFADSSDEDDSDCEDSDNNEDVDVTDCSAFNKTVAVEPLRDPWVAFLSDLPPELVELNLKWRKENSDIPADEKTPGKISFADEDSLVKVHEMDTWIAEYHEARISPWTQLALDHERFQNRIGQLEALLEPVLRPEHRERIWRMRFDSVPADT